ncbi:family 43 glycosylhydrolase [Luteibacter yeojuensis]|uniref:Family 43 glycosylhydrolase n=1 Tax=Luteibacter yeojuensis TaxID=345309 RepID=A0A7X5QW37_9GAMM|nr:family 43 glycosylhydrolase [Luteibacter yeojuensis]NID16461.1 family 43 glycosylhydrolase [Luteibacter yeojuensis]
MRSILLATALAASPWLANAAQRTYANPLDIDYRYNFEQMNEGISYRTGADPAIVRYGDAYYLFQTLADGYWTSKDLVRWDFVEPDRWPFVGVVAPATLVAGGRLFLMPSAFGPRPLMVSTDPAHGHWTFWTRQLPQVPGATQYDESHKMAEGDAPPPGPWDPGLFQDDDGKVYLYWDSSDTYPLYGAQMDFKLDSREGGEKRLAFVTQPKALLHLDPANHGWERFGPDHTMGDKPSYIEGSWMNKHGGRYYFQYAAPGTEYNVYATGVYVGKGPLGPFEYAPYNPVGYKPGGFVTGAGHGSTFQDVHGNAWNTGTAWLGVNWTFERRIDMFPAGWHDDGQMWVDTRFGDFPHRMPDRKLREGEDTFTGWMLLSYRKPVVASSTMPGHPASTLTDEDPRTFWVAQANESGQTLTLDLGGTPTVRAVQVDYADYASGRYADAPDLVTRFVLQGSADGKQWTTLADLSEETRDRPNAYIELERPRKLRFIRYVHRHVGAKQLAISDLRVFGNADGQPPAAPRGLQARRGTDEREATISWKPVPGAVGYNVRWGLAADRLHSTYQRFADQPTSFTLRSLNKGVRYVVAVEAFDERGVSPLSQVVQIVP